jgi:hypothetical protein
MSDICLGRQTTDVGTLKTENRTSGSEETSDGGVFLRSRGKCVVTRPHSGKLDSPGPGRDTKLSAGAIDVGVR